MRSRRAESLSTLTHEDASSLDPPPPKRRKKGHSMESLLAREVGLMRDASGEASASFVGSASGIHFIRAVWGAVGSANVEETSPATNLVPGEDDRLEAPAPSGAKRRIWHDQEVASATHNQIAGNPSFDELLDWTEDFFDNWHPPFPVLHAPSVLASLEKLSEHGINNLATWDSVVVRAIISISLADRRQSAKPLSRPLPSDLVFSTFDDAHEAILPALTRPATIAGIQAVICVQLFLVSMLRLNTASRLGGLIVQMAFQLGLHRCPSRYQNFPQSERQSRKRIFWAMYCLERYICQAMGLPLTIRDDDADVCHLNEEIHRPKPQQHPPSYNHTRNATERDASPAPDGRLQLLVFLSQHAQLRGSIIELRNKRVEERDRNPDVAILINARLTQWWNEVEDFFDQSEPSASSISRLHKAVLETLKHESIIMLHRPMLALPKTAASYASAVHACIGAAKSLLSVLYVLTEEPMTTGSSGSFNAPMMWPSFTWAVWMSAFILLYATTEGIVNGQVAGRNVDKSLRILNRLALRGSVWPEASAVAIQDLRSILTERNGMPPTPSSTTARDSTDQPRQTFPQTTTPVHQRGISNAEGTRSSDSSAPIQRTMPEFRTQNSTGAGSTATQEPPRAWVHSGNQTSWHEQQHQAPTSRTSNHNALNVHDVFATDPDSDLTWPDPSFMPKDVPPMAFGTGDPFQGFDIPFWFGQDNTVAWMGNEP